MAPVGGVGKRLLEFMG